MPVIPIQRLTPASGAVPTETYHPVSLATYWEWELNDEAHFSVIVPSTYDPRTNAVLSLQESTPSVSARHKWQFTCSLIRPGVHNTSEAAPTETFLSEIISQENPDRLVSRSITVTGASVQGHIAGVQIAPADLLSFGIKRISASSDEDPSAIRVFGLAMEFWTDDTSISECAGRCGRIVDGVRDLFNESTGGFLPDQFILRSINRCLHNLAQEDYWRRESWIACIAGSNRISLLEAVPDFQRLHHIYYSGRSIPMKPLGSFQEYEELKTNPDSTGVPEYYVVQNTDLYFWPRVSRSSESGFCMYHSYLPEDITCGSVNPNPPIPAAHDLLLVYYVLKEAFLRDRHAPGADVKFHEYSALYEQEKQRLLGAGDSPHLGLRSYR